MTRSADRESFPDQIRLRLLEGDADESDTKLDAIRGEIAALRQVLTGILVALVVASIMLSLNLVVGH